MAAKRLSRNASTGTLQKVLIRDLQVDFAYQRKLDSFRVRTLSSNFTWDLFGVIEVSRRADSTLYVIDGQHRVAAARAAGHDLKEIDAMVHEGITVNQEADLFHRLNKGRMAVNALSGFRSALHAQYPTEVEVNQILVDLGLQWGSAKGPTLIGAVQALTKVHTRHGNLRRVLTTLKLWHSDPRGSVFDSYLIQGLSVFYRAYPEIDDDKLLKKLQGIDPVVMKKRIKRKKDEERLHQDEAAVREFRHQYNQKNRNPLLSDDAKPFRPPIGIAKVLEKPEPILPIYSKELQEDIVPALIAANRLGWEVAVILRLIRQKKLFQYGKEKSRPMVSLSELETVIGKPIPRPPP